MRDIDFKTMDQLLVDVKHNAFTDPNAVSDEEAFGLLLSQYFVWNGQAIFETAKFAFEDSNFHTFNEAFVAEWEKENSI